MLADLDDRRDRLSCHRYDGSGKQHAPVEERTPTAAATATATNATITATFPAITGAGFEKTLPAVNDSVVPAEVCRT